MLMDTQEPRGKVRLSLDVSAELNRRLEEIAAETGTTKSDVLRKALVLFDVAVGAKGQGKKLYVSDQPPAGASQEIVGI
jgi:hypothetical protein